MTDIAAVAVNRVNGAGTTGTVSDTTQSDVSTTGNGHVSLTTVAGSLRINDGDGNGVGVQAAGEGRVHVGAGGTGDVVLGADVAGTTGHVSVSAAGAVGEEDTALRRCAA